VRNWPPSSERVRPQRIDVAHIAVATTLETESGYPNYSYR
jgi:hypothetical protein